MSVLEDYEKKCGLAPIDAERVLFEVEVAEGKLRDEVSSARNFSDLPTYNRVLVWLHDRLQAVYAALENPKAPVAARCAWCFRAAGGTDEAWRALPVMNMEDSAAHAQVCEHNPLVSELAKLRALLEEHGFIEGQAGHALEAENEDLRGRALSVDERGLRDKIRKLLKSDKPAGELRKAIAELVR